MTCVNKDEVFTELGIEPLVGEGNKILLGGVSTGGGGSWCGDEQIFG